MACERHSQTKLKKEKMIMKDKYSKWDRTGRTSRTGRTDRTNVVACWLGLALLAGLGIVIGCHVSGVMCHVVAGGLSLAAAPLVLTEEQVKEFQSILSEMKGGWAEIKRLPEVFASFQG